MGTGTRSTHVESQAVDFATGVVDAYAADRGRFALYAVGPSGEVTRWTFWDLSVRSTAVAAALGEVSSGDRVLIAVEPGADLCVAMLAAFRLGAVPVIVDSSGVEVEEVLDRAEPAAIVASETAAEMLGPGRAAASLAAGRAPSGWQSFDARASGSRRLQSPAPPEASPGAALWVAEPASAVRPRLLARDLAAIEAERDSARLWLDVRRADLHWAALDPRTSLGIGPALLGPWTHGVPVVLAPPPAGLGDVIARVTELDVSTLCIRGELASAVDAPGLRKLEPWPTRRVCTLGEPVGRDAASLWPDLTGSPLATALATPEAGLLAGHLTETPVQPGSYGRPFPGVEIDVRGGDGGSVPTGVLGELTVLSRSPAQIRGSVGPQGQLEGPAEPFATGVRVVRDDRDYLWPG